MSTMTVLHSDGQREQVTNGIYLGDGVYGWHDGYQHWLGVSRGSETAPWECIALDDMTARAVIHWLQEPKP